MVMEKKSRGLNSHHVFWEALVISVFIIGLGFLLGVFFENARVNEISQLYSKSEIDLLDIKIQSEIISTGRLSCSNLIKTNVGFADRVFQEAKLLDEYELSQKFTKEQLKEQHKRYDLLRTLLWINSLEIKEQCGEDSLHTLVYLYKYETEDSEERQKQIVMSRFAGMLGESLPDENIVIIPIAYNLELSSLDLLLEKYGINQTIIMWDETLKVHKINDLENFSGEVLSTL
jgi:hypothetical protein